jgi:hypothetical protein
MEALARSQNVCPDVQVGMQPPVPIEGSHTVPAAQSWSDAQARKQTPENRVSISALSGLGQNVPLGQPSLHQRAQKSSDEVGLVSPNNGPVAMEKQPFGCAPHVVCPAAPMSQARPNVAAIGSRGP